MEQPSKEGVTQAALSNQRWLTVEQLVPGMVLARPVVVAARGVLAMKLGEGCELTASLISQMYARGIECVAIAIPPPEEDAAWLARQLAGDVRLASVVDGMAEKPFLREMTLRLPRALWPVPKAYGHVMAFTEDGKIVADLQDPSGAYPETTAVTETADRLYVQSLHAKGLGWLDKK